MLTLAHVNFLISSLILQKSALEQDIIMVDVDTKAMLDSFVTKEIPSVVVAQR